MLFIFLCFAPLSPQSAMSPFGLSPVLLSSSPVFILVSLCLYVSIPFLFWESHVLFVLCSVLLPLSCQSDSIQQGSQLCPLCLNALQCISVLCCSREFCVSLVIWKLVLAGVFAFLSPKIKQSSLVHPLSLGSAFTATQLTVTKPLKFKYTVLNE